MKLSVLFTGLLLSSYIAMGTPPSLFNWLPRLFPLSLTGLLPFPLALPLAMVGPLPWVLPVFVGLKGAGMLGLGFATGGVAGAGLAGLGALGVKVALANSIALKAASLGVVAAKAVTSAGASAAAGAGVKAIAAGAKSKIAAPVVAPVPPVVAAPTVPLSPVVPAAITNVKVIKQAPPAITARPVPVDPWKVTAIWPAGWGHTLTYGHPLFGYSFSRSAIDLRRKRRDSPAPNAALDAAGDMSPQMLKNIFSYISSYDSERCVLRVICEVAAEPSLAGPDGKSVADFMTSLSMEDSAAPWMPYRDAAVTGQVSANRTRCLQQYPTCTKSTQSLVELARSRIAHASATASAGAPKV